MLIYDSRKIIPVIVAIQTNHKNKQKQTKEIIGMCPSQRSLIAVSRREKQ